MRQYARRQAADLRRQEYSGDDICGSTLPLFGRTQLLRMVAGPVFTLDPRRYFAQERACGCHHSESVLVRG